ncbi:MAG: PadR family transcriptional regulator [Candidatus Acidiferrales bacterium]
MRRVEKRELTTPDLVLLSLLAERAMHGYQANAELERREVRDWAGISRPQVYYSLEKLVRLGLVRAAKSAERVAGPERSVFATTPRGRRAFAKALEREEWTSVRERPPFVTWLILSWQVPPRIFRRQVRRRREYLERELAREEATLKGVIDEVGHRFHEAVWSITLMISMFRTELQWLAKLSREFKRRAPARRPQYAAPEMK